jgi:bacillolysin
MKKKLFLVIFAILLFGSISFLVSQAKLAPQTNPQIHLAFGKQVAAGSAKEVLFMKAFLESQIKLDNFKLAKVQTEEQDGYVHKRYDVYYQGVKIWGAQMIDHQKNGKTYYINGNYYDDIQIPVTPRVEIKDAIKAAEMVLPEGLFQPYGETELTILPFQAGYFLAYKIMNAKPDAIIVSFVNAATGALIFSYNDVKSDPIVGIGKGIFGDWRKLSTELNGGKYYLNDIMRPAKIITANMFNSEDLSKNYYITSPDGNWADPVSVCAHSHAGWIYDYFNQIHGRKGMDGANSPLIVNIHYGVNYSNAFYTGQTKQIYFGDGDPNSQYPYPAGLDVMCHEFTHGVTDSTSALIYFDQPGSLNEALSDIMGVSCEFRFQPVGYGVQMADWWEGEDYRKPFQAGRDLSDPARLIFETSMGWHYPDHMTKYYDFTPYNYWDNNGVHINQAIVTHAYYLLCQGGTNKTSGRTVGGIGVAKGEKIFYRAWVNYLAPASTFSNARAACMQAAIDIYGAGSTEVGRVNEAFLAVGVI